MLTSKQADRQTDKRGCMQPPPKVVEVKLETERISPNEKLSDHCRLPNVAYARRWLLKF